MLERLWNLEKWKNKKKPTKTPHHCWKSSFTPIKIKQQYIKCMHFESSKFFFCVGMYCLGFLSHIATTLIPESLVCRHRDYFWHLLATELEAGLRAAEYIERFGFLSFLFKHIFLQGWWTVTWIKAACPKSVFITAQQSLCIFFLSLCTVL